MSSTGGASRRGGASGSGAASGRRGAFSVGPESNVYSKGDDLYDPVVSANVSESDTVAARTLKLPEISSLSFVMLIFFRLWMVV